MLGGVKSSSSDKPRHFWELPRPKYVSEGPWSTQYSHIRPLSRYRYWTNAPFSVVYAVRPDTPFVTIPVLNEDLLLDAWGRVWVWAFRSGRYNNYVTNHLGSAAHSANVQDSPRGWRLLMFHTSAVIDAWKDSILECNLDSAWGKIPVEDISADSTRGEM